MDEVDFFNLSREMEEAHRNQLIAESVARRREPRDLCLNCDELLPEERRLGGFCDVDCREDWELREAARRRNGAGQAFDG